METDLNGSCLLYSQLWQLLERRERSKVKLFCCLVFSRSSMKNIILILNTGKTGYKVLLYIKCPLGTQPLMMTSDGYVGNVNNLIVLKSGNLFQQNLGFKWRNLLRTSRLVKFHQSWMLLIFTRTTILVRFLPS